MKNLVLFVIAFIYSTLSINGQTENEGRLDIHCAGKAQAIRYACILLDIADGKKLDFDELILEKRGTTIWVHFAVRPRGNRRYVHY